MKKTLLLLSLFVLCLFVLCSCSSEQNDTTNGSDNGISNAPCTHSFGDWLTIKEASCTEKGELVRICSLCSHSEITYIATNNKHTEVIDDAVAPTCTATGLTAGKHCSVCEAILEAQTVVDALGHSEGAVVIENNIAPDCVNAGSYENVVYCTVCEAELSIEKVTVDALGHTEVVDEAVAPTCTETGLTTGKHCSACGEILIPQIEVEPSHDFSDWNVISSPRFAYEGAEERVCKCGFYETRSIDRLWIEYSSSYSMDPEKNIDIVFWAKHNTNITQANIYKKAVEEFNALYPNISITLRLYSSESTLRNDLIVSCSSGSQPDAFLDSPLSASYYSSTFDLVSFNELIEHPDYGISKISDTILNTLLNQTKTDDNFFALPFMHSQTVCYVNKTYVEKLGFELPDELTLDFMLAVSEAAMKKNADGTFTLNGQHTLYPIMFKSASDILYALLSQAGKSDIFNSDKTFFNDEALDIFYLFADMFSKKYASTFKISNYPSNFFNKGQCIFAFDTSAGATWYGSNAPNMDISEDDISQFETAVMSISGFGDILSQGLSVYLTNSKDQDKIAAAWLFARYLLSEAVQIEYAITEGYLPTRQAIVSDADFLEYISKSGTDNNTYYDVKISATKTLLENVSSTVAPQNSSNYNIDSSCYDWLVNQIALSARKNVTINYAYFKDLFSQMISLYHLITL